MTPTHCISCGSEVPDHAEFCHACGSAVYRPEDKRQLPEPAEPEPAVEQPPEPAPAEAPVSETINEPTDDVGRVRSWASMHGLHGLEAEFIRKHQNSEVDRLDRLIRRRRSRSPKTSPETSSTEAPSTEAPGEGEPVARPEFYHFGLTEDYSYFFLVGWVIFPLAVGAFFSAFGAGIVGFVFGAAATLAIYYIFTSRQRRWAAARATYSRFVKAHYTHPYKKSKWETSEQARARAEAENLGDDKWSECSDAVKHFNRGITFWNAAETVDEFLAKANGEFRRSCGYDSDRAEAWYWVAATADPSDVSIVSGGHSKYLELSPNGRYADHSRRVLQVHQEWRTS